MDSVPTQNNSINNNKNGPTINTTFKPAKLSRHNSFIPYTQRPKHLSFIKPVRQYRRLPEGKKDSTGIDPVGKLKEFINKDTIKSLLRPSLYDKFDIKNPSYRHSDLVKTRKNNPNKWALNTTCKAPNYEKLPKVQQFTIYYFPSSDSSPKKKSIIKTDHIGIKIPNLHKIDERNSFLKKKNGYSVSSETRDEDKWMLFDVKKNNNESSKNYDIINFKNNFKCHFNNNLLNKTLHHKKKGFEEYNDLTHTFHVRINKDYMQKYMENPKRFYRSNGIFTNMYDISHRNGNIIKPFGKAK